MRRSAKAAGIGVALFVLLAFLGANFLSPNAPEPSFEEDLPDQLSAELPAQVPAKLPATSVGCDKSLWQHVYNPSRLKIVSECMTVTGVIEVVRKEKDGDLHILLKLDRPFANLTNSANDKSQKGDLVLEPICQDPVSQEDAKAACASFSKHVEIPKVGTHVSVTGSYVLDLQHQGWAEIHPVTSVTVIP